MSALSGQFCRKNRVVARPVPVPGLSETRAVLGLESGVEVGDQRTPDGRQDSAAQSFSGFAVLGLVTALKHIFFTISNLVLFCYLNL